MLLFFIILLLSILLVLDAFVIVVQLTSLYLRIYIFSSVCASNDSCTEAKVYASNDSYSASVSSLSLSSFAKSSALSPDVSASNLRASFSFNWSASAISSLI